MAKKKTKIIDVEPLEDDQETSEVVEDTSDEESVEATNEDVLEGEDIVEDAEEHEHEEEHMSLSSRFLRILAIFAVGVLFALWAGPKVAPLLPAGLKPVADFLSPQTDVSAQITEVQANFDARIADVEAANANADLLTQIGSKLDQLAKTNAGIEARLDTVSKAANSLEARMTALEDELMKINTRQALTSQNGDISDQALKGFEDKLAAIAAAQQKLNQSQTLAVEAKLDATTKLRVAQTTTALSQISDALETGSPFQKPLGKLSEVAGVQMPAELTNVAQTGAPALSYLKKQFPELARIALRTDHAATSEGNTLAKFTSFLKSQVGTRSLEPQQGDSLDAVLSRIEASLTANDLNTALTEAGKLNDPAKQTMGDWVASLTQLNNARKAVETLQTQLTPTLK